MKVKNGFSLIQVLVAAGIVGGLSLVIVELISMQNRASRKAMVDQDVFEVVNRVQISLLNADACRHTMAQFNSLNAPATGVTTIRNKDNLPVSLNNLNVRVLSIEVVPPVPPVNAESNIKIKLNLERNLGNSLSNYTREVGVTVTTDASNNVIGCYSALDSAISTAINNACASLGGTMVGGNCVFSGQMLLDLITDFQTRISTLESQVASLAPTPTPFPTPTVTLYNTGNCSASCMTPYVSTPWGPCSQACTTTLGGAGVVSTPTSVLTGSCTIPAAILCPARSCSTSCTATNTPL